MEKLAIIYNYIFMNMHKGEFDASEYLELCEKFGIAANPQKINYFNSVMSIEGDSVIVLIDDEKYDYHAVCFSSVLLDDLISEGKLSFNSFLIPLKFIDAVKFKVDGKEYRMCPAENEGLFFSNNKRNFDIQKLSSLTGLDVERIIDMKNGDFLSDDIFKRLLKNVSQLTNLEADEVCDLKNKLKNLFFAIKTNAHSDRLCVAQKAKELVGMQIVKDNQNSTFDCASFVAYLFMSEIGVDIQHGGYGNSTTGKIMSSSFGDVFLIDERKSIEEKSEFVLKNAEIGDVMLFHRQSANSTAVEDDNWYPGHVGMYIGDGKYIDARHRRGDVRVVDISNDEYMKCFIGLKRFILEKSYDSQEFENAKQNI